MSKNTPGEARTWYIVEKSKITLPEYIEGTVKGRIRECSARFSDKIIKNDKIIKGPALVAVKGRRRPHQHIALSIGGSRWEFSWDFRRMGLVAWGYFQYIEQWDNQDNVRILT